LPYTEAFSEKLLRKLVRRTDIEDALKRLDLLTQEEARMAAVEVLKLTHAIDERVRGIEGTVTVVDDKVTRVDDRVAGIDDRIQGVSDQVQGVGDGVRGVGDKVSGVIDGAQYIFNQSLKND